ncbi:MAG: nucleotidyltransferase domain-containing protein [bacterium]|nr:nucleotidyltransferase domain-containing protein [bacterium]
MQAEVRKIRDQIVKEYNPQKIILFGSYAKNCQKENSDADLVVIKNTKDRMFKRMEKISKVIHSPLGTDVLIYTPKEWQKRVDEEDYFLMEIQKTGKIIYEKNKE